MPDVPEKVGSAYVEVSAKESEGAGSVSSLLKGLGVGVAAAAAVATTAVVGFATKSMFKVQELGHAVDSVQDITGIAAESASRMIYAFKSWGVSNESMMKSLKVLSKQVASNSKDFQEFGINTHDASGNILPMDAVLDNVADRFAAMPDGIEKTNMALKLFGKAGEDMIDVMNGGAAGLHKLGAESDKYGMTLGQGMVDAAEKNAKAHRQMSAMWEGFQVKLGAKLMPVITKLTTWLVAKMPGAFAAVGRAIHRLQPLFDGIRNAILYFWDGVTGMGTNEGTGIFLFMNRLGMRVAELRAWFVEHWPAMKAAAIAALKAIGKAIEFVYERVLPALIDAVRAVVRFCIEHFPEVRRVVMEVFDWIRDNVVPVVVAVAKGIANAFMAMVTWVRTHWDQISADVMNVVHVIQDVFTVGFEVVKTIITTAIDVIVGAWNLFGDQILAVLSAAWDTIKGVFEGALQVIQGIFEFFWNIFQGKWGAAWNGIKDVLEGIWHAIQALIEGGVRTLAATLEAAWNGIKAGVSAAWDGIKALVSGAWDLLKSTVSSGVDALVGFMEALPGRILTGLANLGHMLWGLATDAMGLLMAGVSNGWEILWGFVTSLPGKFLSAFESLGSDLAGLFSRAIRGLLGSIKAAWNWLADQFSFELPSVTIPMVGTIGGGHVNLLPHLETGGRAIQSGLAVVGEKGAEIVKLGRGDTVYPHGSGPGGGPIGMYVENQTIMQDVDLEVYQRRAAYLMASAGVG